VAGLPNMDEAAWRAFVDEHRARCLWFLKPDYYPATPEASLRVLRSIEQHGDRQAFVRAAEFRQWLSHHSSATSVGS
jgi:hypothetical protein